MISNGRTYFVANNICEELGLSFQVLRKYFSVNSPFLPQWFNSLHWFNPPDSISSPGDSTLLPGSQNFNGYAKKTQHFVYLKRDWILHNQSRCWFRVKKWFKVLLLLLGGVSGKDPCEIMYFSWPASELIWVLGANFTSLWTENLILLTDYVVVRSFTVLPLICSFSIGLDKFSKPSCSNLKLKFVYLRPNIQYLLHN